MPVDDYTSLAECSAMSGRDIFMAFNNGRDTTKGVCRALYSFHLCRSKLDLSGLVEYWVEKMESLATEFYDGNCMDKGGEDRGLFINIKIH